MSLQDLTKWFNLAKELKEIKEKELALRNELFTHYFPKPIEGVNTFDLNDGSILKGTYKLNRSLDEAALFAVLKKLGEGSYERLINVKVKLNVKGYKKLPEDQRYIMDEALITVPGSPILAISAPETE